MLMYHFRKLSAYAPIYEVHFAVRVRSSGLESLLCGDGFGLQQPHRSSVEPQYLQVIGATIPFGEKKGSNWWYRIELASNTLAEKAFERCQRSLYPFESNASMVRRRLDYIITKQNTAVEVCGSSLASTTLP